jgi:hypothetical protein
MAILNKADHPPEGLPADECWALLSTAEVGRLAIAGLGSLDIFPVNHRAQRRRLFFRTGPGTKLRSLLADSRVAFEVDGWDDREAWSVVVKGTAEPVQGVDDLITAEGARPIPWTGEGKNTLVEIIPTEVSGRRFPRRTQEDLTWYW